MRGPKINAIIAEKKLDPDTTKKKMKVRASSKDSGAPKRPPCAFFIFMEQFRKDNKENFPANKSASAIAKEGGAIWKSMTESEKAPYVAKAARKKAEYEIAIKQHNDNLNGTAMETSSTSSLNIRDDADQEASSQIIKLGC